MPTSARSPPLCFALAAAVNIKGFFVEKIKVIWFWFTLVACPLLIVLGVFTLGNLIGQYIYAPDFSLSSISSIQIVFMCSGVCAFSVLLSTLKEARIRFAK